MTSESRKERQKECGAEKNIIIEETAARTTLNLARDIYRLKKLSNPSQKIIPKKSPSRHLIIKLLEIKDKEKTLKETRER